MADLGHATDAEGSLPVPSPSVPRPITLSNVHHPPEVAQTGITELYNPDQTVDVIADIVFVHGLGGHPKQTWVFGEEPKREAPTKTSVWSGLFTSKRSKNTKFLEKDDSLDTSTNTISCCFWPYDLLPKALPNVRIMTYGYDSNPTNFYKSSTTKATITQHAGGLMHRVAAVRNTCRGRPLIFVAHSLGGILVKGALNESQQMMNRQLAHADLKQSCRAIVFLGTPHQGADTAAWGQMFSNIVGALPGGPSTYSNVLQGLSPDSETLDNINRRFNELLDDSAHSQVGLKITSVQEGKGLSGVRPFDFKVVPDHSSKLNRTNIERSFCNDLANHMSMCKFSSDHDQGYKDILLELQDYCQEIGAANARAQEQQETRNTIDSQAFLDISRSLFYPDIHQRAETIRDRQSSTLEWIWEPPHHRQLPWDSFVDWFDDIDPRKVYWISGNPGTGKSVLMKYVSERLTSRNELNGDGFRTHTLRNPRCVLSFYFWEAGSEYQRNTIGCLRSVLWQLLQHPSFGSTATTVIQRFASATWTQKRLKSALKAALDHVGAETVIFLDGLDECQDRDVLLDLVEVLKEYPCVKLCLSSRPEQIFVNTFEGYPKLKMQDVNHADIKKLVREKLLDNPVLARFKSAHQNTLELMAEMVISKAQGVFLWVRLAIQNLLNGFHNRDGIEILQSRLNRFPDDLYGLYNHMWLRGESDNQYYRECAALYFKLILHREFDLTQFYIAVNSDLRRHYLQEILWPAADTADISNTCLEDLVTWINVRTAGMLEVYTDPEIYPESFASNAIHSIISSVPADKFAMNVQFIHRTARDYLLDTSEGKSLLESCPLRADEIAQVCLETNLVFVAARRESDGSQPTRGVRFMPDFFLCCVKCDECEGFEALWSTQDTHEPCVGLYSREVVPTNATNALAYGLGRVPYTHANIPSDHVSLDLCQLVASCCQPEVIESQLNRLQLWRDVDYLSLLLVRLFINIKNRDANRDNRPDVYEQTEKLWRLISRLLHHGASFNREMTNSIGEHFRPIAHMVAHETCFFVAKEATQSVALQYSSPLSLETPHILTRMARLVALEADFTLPCLPLCRDCYRWLKQRRASWQLWGAYTVNDVLASAVSHDWNASRGHSSRIYVLFEMIRVSKSTGFTAFYAISASDSDAIMSALTRPSGQRCNGVCAWSAGIISILEPYEQEHQKHDCPLIVLIHEIQKRSERLNSFAEALQCMGKSAETVRKWAIHHPKQDSEWGEEWTEWMAGPDKKFWDRGLLEFWEDQNDQHLLIE